jgi:SAM-dependent methyltransferase
MPASKQVEGVDFDFVSVEDLRVPSDCAHVHSNSGGPTLARGFETIDVPAGSVALDLGSRKGSAALTLSGAGFAEVIGVELSGKLIEIARDNAARLRQRNVRFVQADAAAFGEYDGVTRILPFACGVMRQVVANLVASLARAPRPLTIVYRNPLCHDVIVASGLFDAGDEHHPDEHTWRVCSTKPQAAVTVGLTPDVQIAPQVSLYRASVMSGPYTRT